MSESRLHISFVADTSVGPKFTEPPHLQKGGSVQDTPADGVLKVNSQNGLYWQDSTGRTYWTPPKGWKQ